MIIEQKLINKPWGHEIIWSKCSRFVGKILCIKAGHQLSRQFHKNKEETIYVLSGTLLLELGMGATLKKIELKKGQSFHIFPNTIHRFVAKFGYVELAEVSSPELDDIVRLEDDYNRTK
tara:strand:- start:1865 stop:2221 length:357 start_codon:yes stop_codon:yes gene_type:complete